VQPLAEVLSNLGVKRGVVVSGSDGMDEVTLTGETHVCEIRDDSLTCYDITPEQFGFQRCQLEDLAGGSPADNARITREILSGQERGPKRDEVVLNAAIALYLGIDDCSVADCVRLAEELIDSGRAAAKLEEFRRLSNEVH